LRRGGYSRKWWKAFTLLSFAGTVVGLWFALFLNYNVANKRLEGFPIPWRISNREKPADPWVTAPMPAAIRIGGIATDWLCGIALCLLPIAAAAFLKENRTERGAPGNPRVNHPS
jgi:hypothetical protein